MSGVCSPIVLFKSDINVDAAVIVASSFPKNNTIKCEGNVFAYSSCSFRGGTMTKLNEKAMMKKMGKSLQRHMLAYRIRETMSFLDAGSKSAIEDLPTILFYPRNQRFLILGTK